MVRQDLDKKSEIKEIIFLKGLPSKPSRDYIVAPMFWLLTYFLILLNCAKFEDYCTTFILYILQGSPLLIFGKLQKQKNIQGGPL
jgi:hypothetical protein